MKPEVTAAIARLTANRYTEDIRFSPAGSAIRARQADLMTLREHYLSTLDPRPITAEGLKERGFVLNGDEWRHLATNLRVSQWTIKGETTFGPWGVRDTYRNVIPEELEPQNMGDLTTLLLRLERGVG